MGRVRDFRATTKDETYSQLRTPDEFEMFLENTNRLKSDISTNFPEVSLVGEVNAMQEKVIRIMDINDKTRICVTQINADAEAICDKNKAFYEKQHVELDKYMETLHNLCIK